MGPTWGVVEAVGVVFSFFDVGRVGWIGAGFDVEVRSMAEAEGSGLVWIFAWWVIFVFD